MLQNKKLLSYALLALFAFGLLVPVQAAYAAPNDTIGKSTLPSPAGGGSFIERLFGLLFDGILGPILGIFTNGKSESDTPSVVKPLPPKESGSILDKGVLRGKVIVVDPGHGGHNPGAVSNGVQEADINLSISTLLRDKLSKEGAKVIMTRQSDNAVASNNSSLGQELQARVDIAEKNNADLFISIHSNSNPDKNIAGAMTFYPKDSSSQLAIDVQKALIEQTGAVDKSVASATFYVLRNTTMPSILVETGFVTNKQEALKLNDYSYQNKIAQGVYNGVIRYLQSH
ncbi:cell wall hydrolase [Anaerosporomusa subterranea]|uniref:Cell wall hydrolase n=1 Tax=Anaerosporomusa subterranea TaxID=1794912 RepID=A0A154BTA9_ANASB|nr:N-acetylmuramoyl-L-alanine amidase [Anaerosporomusa subterranea]KYZ77243.1 cell wall hydrolase [Anaerosporomusa subterranea]